MVTAHATATATAHATAMDTAHATAIDSASAAYCCCRTQVAGEWQASQAELRVWLAAVTRLQATFVSFSIRHIPR